MSLEDKLATSDLGLKGLTPIKGKGTDISSTTHAVDPTPGVQGDETISFDSAYDLDGKTPSKIKGSERSSDTHVYDPTPGSQGDEVVRFKSAYAPPQSQTKFASTAPGGGNPSNFSSDGPITRD